MQCMTPRYVPSRGMQQCREQTSAAVCPEHVHSAALPDEHVFSAASTYQCWHCIPEQAYRALASAVLIVLYAILLHFLS